MQNNLGSANILAFYHFELFFEKIGIGKWELVGYSNCRRHVRVHQRVTICTTIFVTVMDTSRHRGRRQRSCRLWRTPVYFLGAAGNASLVWEEPTVWRLRRIRGRTSGKRFVGCTSSDRHCKHQCRVDVPHSSGPDWCKPTAHCVSTRTRHWQTPGCGHLKPRCPALSTGSGEDLSSSWANWRVQK